MVIVPRFVGRIFCVLTTFFALVSCSTGGSAPAGTALSPAPVVGNGETGSGEEKWARDPDALSVYKTTRFSCAAFGSEKVASDIRAEYPEFHDLDGSDPFGVAEAWASGYRFNKQPAFEGCLEGLLAYQREGGPVSFPVD